MGLRWEKVDCYGKPANVYPGGNQASWKPLPHTASNPDKPKDLISG